MKPPHEGERARTSSPPAAKRAASVLDSQAIGDRAEDAFKSLCTEGKIIANPSTRDRRGWDFVLECPFPNEVRTSDAVARPTQITCFAQVKGSLTDSGAVPISLAHLERMSKERIPWFVQIVILATTPPHRPCASYLVHVDERVVTKVVKRLFDSSLTGASTLEQTMDVNWGETDRIDLSGDALLAKIRAHVPDIVSYPELKMQWLESARAELQRLSGTISFYYRSDRAVYEALAKLAIGDLDYIPLRSFSAKGDLLKKTSKSGSVKIAGAALRVEPFDIGETTIELQGKSGTARLRCATRSANVAFPSIPGQYNKLRFDSRFLKFVVSNTSAALTWNVKLLNLDGEATLAELDAAMRAMELLSTSGVRVTVTTPSGKQASYSAVETMESDQNSAGFVFVVTHACAVARVLGMALDSVDVDVAKLLTQWRRLLLLRAAVDVSCKLDQFSIWLPEEPSHSEAAIVLCPGVDLGDTVMVGCGALIGPITVTPEEAGYRVSIVAPTLRPFERAVYASDQWSEVTVRKLMDDAASQLEKEGVSLIVTADPPIRVRTSEPSGLALPIATAPDSDSATTERAVMV